MEEPKLTTGAHLSDRKQAYSVALHHHPYLQFKSRPQAQSGLGASRLFHVAMYIFSFFHRFPFFWSVCCRAPRTWSLHFTVLTSATCCYWRRDATHSAARAMSQTQPNDTGREKKAGSLQIKYAARYLKLKGTIESHDFVMMRPYTSIF